MTADLIILAILVVPPGLAIFAWWRLHRVRRRFRQSESRVTELTQKYGAILDVEARAAAERAALKAEADEIAGLRATYAEKRKIFNELSSEVALLSGRLDYAELGLYEPDLAIGASAEYTAALARNREQQKALIGAGRAVSCSTQWTVDGNRRKGETMANRAIRLTLRAFNTECEVLIGRVSWNNRSALRDRILKVKATLDKLNQSNAVSITEQFLQLKLEELDLSHREKLAKRQEQERLREERAAAREEERAQREIEAELRRTLKEEELRREALAKATAQLEAATGAEQARLMSQIADLEAKLTAAQADKERALSMAQQTRVGYVYVISNIGSFGERMVKIGMTRRVDPMERIIELGDASVPFPFDVHALVFSDDAPGLERKLHQALDAHRTNRVNLRKEFFQVELAKVQAILATTFPDVPFIEKPKAEQYYQSLAKPDRERIAQKHASDRFPTDLNVIIPAEVSASLSV